jgi:hypothetical protein
MTNDLDNLYGSKYLSAGHVEEDFTTSIVDVTTETFEKSGEPARTKAVLWLADEDRPLILNKTNALALGAEYGKNFKGWIGKPVEIRKERVNFGGKPVEALRVYPERKRPAPRRSPSAGASSDITDDAIPF